MLRADETLAGQLEAAVTDLERHTSVEVVVVLARRSDPYPEAAWIWGSVTATLVLALVLFSPIDFQPWLVIPGTLFVSVGVALAARSQDALVRRVVPRARQLRQVQQAAQAAFVEEAAHGTRGRDAVLVYVSALEGRVALVPDLGLRRRVPPGALQALRWGGGADPHAIDTSANLLAGLEALGALLAERVPPRGENPDELHNAPRIRA